MARLTPKGYVVRMPVRGLVPHESEYAGQLVYLLRQLWEAVKTQVFPSSLAAWDEQRTDAMDFESVSDLFKAFRLAWFERETASAHRARVAAQRAALGTEEVNRRELNKRLQRVLPVDPFDMEPWLRQSMSNWITENVHLIKSTQGQMLDRIEQTLYRMLREGKSRAETEKELQEEYGLAKSRAKLIARDQINKFNGQLTMERQTRLGVGLYVWQGTGDQRERGNPTGLYPKADPSHWKMNGLICKWDDPTVYSKDGKRWYKRTEKMPKVHPGQEINCRCWADPILDIKDLQQAAAKWAA